MHVSGKLPTYPSPSLTLTLTSALSKMLGLGRGGWAVSQKHSLIPAGNRGGMVAQWLVQLTLDHLSPGLGTMLCFWARHFTLIVPLSIEVHKINGYQQIVGHPDRVTYDELASPPRGVP